MPAITAYDIAFAQYRSQTIIEAAGLFWLFAELLILFAMTIACAHLRHGGREAFHWERAYTRRLIGWLLVFAVIAAGVALRHQVWPPAHLGIDTRSLEETAAIAAQRERVHLVLWAAFIVGWVALEAAIVGYGLRAYRLLRTVLTRHPGTTPQ